MSEKNFFDDDNVKENFFDENPKIDENIFKSSTSSKYKHNKEKIIETIKTDFENSKPDYPEQKKKSIGGLIFVGVLLACFILAIIEFKKGKENIAIILSLAFMAMIVGVIVVVSVKEKIYMKKPKGDVLKKCGTVLGCTESSTKSYGKKVIVTYRVMLDVEGNKIESYTREPLNKGRKVTVLIKDMSKKYCYMDLEDNTYNN